MKDEIRVISSFPVEFSYEKILEASGCVEGTRTCEKALALLPELEKGLRQTAAPRAWIAFGGARWYCLMTLGRGIEPYLSSCVRKSLLQGVLADSLAQEFLFLIDDAVVRLLRQECRRRNTGISRRLEAPCQLPFEAQQEILDHVKGQSGAEVSLSGSYVFEPPRTMGYILETAPGENCFHAVHSCSGCGNEGCPRRKTSGRAMRKNR